MTYVERAASSCIGQGRADLVLAGCAILEAILPRSRGLPRISGRSASVTSLLTPAQASLALWHAVGAHREKRASPNLSPNPGVWGHLTV